MRQLKYCKYDEENKLLISNEEAANFDEPCFAKFILKCFDRHADRPFMTEAATDVTLTFAEVKQRSLKIASSFINVLSLELGDVVFGYCHTSTTYACTVYACNLAGLVFTGEPARLSPVSLAPQINNCKTKVVLCVRESLPRLLQALDKCPLVKTIILLDPESVDGNNNEDIDIPSGLELIPVDELEKKGDECDEKLPRIPPCDVKDHLVYLPYSSGTTGLAKGVKRCAGSVISMCHNVKARGLMYGHSTDVISCFQSLGHTSGLLSLTFNLYHGSHLVIMRELHLETLLSMIEKYKITCCFFPPTIISAMSKMSLNEKYDLSPVEVICTGGAPLVASTVKDFISKFSNLQRMINCYGLSEGPGCATILPDTSDDYKSVGTVTQGVDLKVVDRETGAVCSFNETGEIYLRSEMCASGYFNRPDAEAETWTEDGWLRTGDAGYYNEDGLIYLVDRIKEMIKVHINQVAPAELQDILCRHPQVSEACVVAAPHPDTGETPRAFVVPKDINALPDEEELIKFVNDQVVEYRRINGGLFLVKSLPKMVVGKHNRQLIKRNPEKLEFLNPNNLPDNLQ